MNDRSRSAELLALLGRFLLFLFLMRLAYPTGLGLFLRMAAPRLSSEGTPEARDESRSIEIIKPLDGFTGPARPLVKGGQQP